MAKWVRTSFRRFTEDWHSLRVQACPVAVPKHSHCLLSSVICWMLKGSLEDQPTLTQYRDNLFDKPFLKPQRIWPEIIMVVGGGVLKPVSRLPTCLARPLSPLATASHHWDTDVTPTITGRKRGWQGWTTYLPLSHCCQNKKPKTSHSCLKYQLTHL